MSLREQVDRSGARREVSSVSLRDILGGDADDEMVGLFSTMLSMNLHDIHPRSMLTCLDTDFHH